MLRCPGNRPVRRKGAEDPLNRTRKAFIANIVVFILEALAVAWIMSGISADGPLEGPNLESLKYYTVDSNILMGLAALAAAAAQRRALRGKTDSVPLFIRLLKLAGTAGVTLTMLVTIYFLGPTLGRVYGFFSLFSGPSLFLHLINPLAAIFVFLRYERTDRLPFRLTPACVLPTALYAVYYVTLNLRRLENGRIAAEYDWYGFFAFGLSVWPLVVAAILLITWGITLALWKLNRGRAVVPDPAG